MLQTKVSQGRVTYKTAYCTHCGDQFQYPSHFKPRPIFCDVHDPRAAVEVDLSQFEAVTSAPAEAPQTLADTKFCLEQVAEKSIELVVTPQGTRFADSPKLKSVEQIRAEYRQRLESRQAPLITPIELPLPKHGPFIGINHVGDIHIGTDACTYDAFKQMLNFVEHTPDEYLAIQGDMVDLLTAHSVGVMAEQALSIHEQVTLATADFLPLAQKGKILWMLRGNHEDRLDKATKNLVDISQTMARILDVRYLQTEGYTQVMSGGIGYLSYNIHGFNAGGRSGSRRNKMESMLAQFPSADVITCGHNHQLDVIQVVDEYVDPQSHRRIHRQRWGVYTGTMHSYTGYAADAGLGQGPLGFARIRFDVGDGSLLPSILPVTYGTDGYKMTLPN